MALTAPAENGALTPASAISAALAAADQVNITASGFRVVAREASKPQVLELRLIRMIGNCERAVSTEVSRAMPGPLFEDACRRSWVFLKGEHERTKKPGEW